MIRRDYQLVSIYLKFFFFLLRSFSLIVCSINFIWEIAHFRLWKLRALLTVELTVGNWERYWQKTAFCIPRPIAETNLCNVIFPLLQCQSAFLGFLCFFYLFKFLFLFSSKNYNTNVTIKIHTKIFYRKNNIKK